MTPLTTEERELGRSNANTVLGVSRRDFLRAAAVAPAIGAFYFGYKGVEKPVKAAIIGTGNEGCQAMIRDHNRAFMDFIGYCDIRPSQQVRAVNEFKAHKDYTTADVEKIKKYDDADAMLADPDVEVVVIALPLWLHAPVAIKAMQAGKHVFCEKLMAHSVGECKAMCRVSRETNKLLAIGHQRHYSTLYDNANYLVQNGFLGDIRHIRAQWHRNNANPRIAKDQDGNLLYDDKGEPVYVRDEQGRIVYFDGWKPDVPKEDLNIDYAKYGYKSLDELIRWRLYNRTGAGLMAELGSHQLDACSIFLGKVHPISVTGVGGTFFYTDGREVDDHVFVTFEFPGKGGREGQDRVVVTYSSINTNAFGGPPLDYGEMVMGSRGTMIVAGERDLMLYKEIDRNTWKAGAQRNTTVTVETKGGKPAMEASPSMAGATGAAVPGTMYGDAPSRGYREELEHFAYCVRNMPDPANVWAPVDQGDPHSHDAQLYIPRCRGEVALADAVIALVSNLAMKQKRNIIFDEAWFDFKSDAVPDESAKDLAMRG
jgi:predicted dehydrogenase